MSPDLRKLVPALLVAGLALSPVAGATCAPEACVEAARAGYYGTVVVGAAAARSTVAAAQPVLLSISIFDVPSAGIRLVGDSYRCSVPVVDDADASAFPACEAAGVGRAGGSAQGMVVRAAEAASPAPARVVAAGLAAVAGEQAVVDALASALLA